MDSLQEVSLIGPQTTAAVQNFQISGRTMPPQLIHALAVIKSEAARVNANQLHDFADELADAIASAADAVAAGAHDDQFPVDVFQTGSGTSTNMNVNEVIAALASQSLGYSVHPNDHVNASQSTNDTFPTAIRLACMLELQRRLLPALESLSDALAAKAQEFGSIVKAGRTHQMDATPILLGDEFAGYESQVTASAGRLRDHLVELGELPIGGTATGNGLNAPPGFAAAMAARLSSRLDLELVEAPNHFAVQGSQDALVELSARLRTVAVSVFKIASDLRWMASGPRTGLRELRIPALQAGSSIMPGKSNPVICEVVTQVSAQVLGNDATMAFVGTQGVLELNTYLPVMAHNLLESLDLLANAVTSMAEHCVATLEVDAEQCRLYAEQTLATAAILNPVIGYDQAAEIVRSAVASGRSLTEEVVAQDILSPAELAEHLDLDKIARGPFERPD